MVTLKQFLETAVLPVGKTMYVWGGGWNKADTGGGRGARHIGVWEKWVNFAGCQTPAYDYHDYLYEIELGLDCSGYVGWCMYNVFRNCGKKEFVYPSGIIGKQYACMGYGSFTESGRVNDYKPGDIMSRKGHVWICVGACQDNSVLLLHASPPGVQLNGTVSPEGRRDSQAIGLAERYMKICYPHWYERYPAVSKGKDYLSDYHQMRWYLNEEKGCMADPEHIRGLSGEKILEILFGPIDEIEGNEVYCGKN
ncbi:MAG: hypothetical protein ACI4GW_00745 [Lachnospiraceae bacterium]